MYKVKFNGVLYATVSSLEEAVSLALAVHRSSNVRHDVLVGSENDENEFLKFHAGEHAK